MSTQEVLLCKNEKIGSEKCFAEWVQKAKYLINRVLSQAETSEGGEKENY